MASHFHTAPFDARLSLARPSLGSAKFADSLLESYSPPVKGPNLTLASKFPLYILHLRVLVLRKSFNVEDYQKYLSKYLYLHMLAQFINHHSLYLTDKDRKPGYASGFFQPSSKSQPPSVGMKKRCNGLQQVGSVNQECRRVSTSERNRNSN